MKETTKEFSAKLNSGCRWVGCIVNIYCLSEIPNKYKVDENVAGFDVAYCMGQSSIFIISQSCISINNLSTGIYRLDEF